MSEHRFRIRTKFSFALGLLALLGFLTGGCTTATLAPESESSSYFKDVVDTENPFTGLHTATFTDFHGASSEVVPLARARNNGFCAESNSYKLYAGGVHWMEMPVTYRFDSSVPNESWKHAIRQAFAAWNTGSSACLVLRLRPQAMDHHGLSFLGSVKVHDCQPDGSALGRYRTYAARSEEFCHSQDRLGTNMSFRHSTKVAEEPTIGVHSS